MSCRAGRRAGPVLACTPPAGPSARLLRPLLLKQRSERVPLGDGGGQRLLRRLAPLLLRLHVQLDALAEGGKEQRAGLGQAGGAERCEAVQSLLPATSGPRPCPPHLQHALQLLSHAPLDSLLLRVLLALRL